MLAQKLTEARALFLARFRDMAVSSQAWHLYATATGLAIEPDGTHTVILVPNVHAVDCQTLTARLQDKLSRGWPHLWV